MFNELPQTARVLCGEFLDGFSSEVHQILDRNSSSGMNTVFALGQLRQFRDVRNIDDETRLFVQIDTSTVLPTTS